MNTIKHDVAKDINYFDLFEFIEKIKLSPRVLEHMEDTNKDFDKYLKKFSQFDDNFAIYFWISRFYSEVKNSNYIENHDLNKFDFTIANLFFDRLSISNSRIHDIHKSIMRDEPDQSKVGVYRKTPVKISSLYDDTEEIFWYGVKEEDIKDFMNSFIEVYKSNSPSVLNSNPFLKSSLIHLLFLKIHPYYDGNGRTARMLHSIKFTQIINSIYGMNLKICPVNLSESIKLNLLSYVKAPDNIYFDLDHDNNEMINYWFNCMLNMYDEQLYRNQGILDNMDEDFEKILRLKEKIDPKVLEQIKNIDADLGQMLAIKNKMNSETREVIENMHVKILKR